MKLVRSVLVSLLMLSVYHGRKSIAEESGELQKLEKLIRYHQNLFWNEGCREISDQEYDKLVNKLKAIDPENKLVLKIESSDSDSRKIKHIQIMRSLRKAYKKEEIFKWCEKVSRNSNEKFVIQTKYDGIAVEYVNNKLSTRGDGVWGNDITEKLALVKVNQLTGSENIGELIISDTFFQKLSTITDRYVSPRHATVAMVNSKSIKFWKENLISFDLVCFSKNEKQMTLEEIKAKWSEITRELKNCGYTTDGIVLKLADSVYAKSLGFTDKYPKGSIAYKWPCQQKWAKLLDVKWQMAEKGLVPVGLIEPTELDGCTIKRVTLYNSDYIQKKKLKLGDLLKIERIGSVIPVIKAVKNLSNGRPIVLENCPECESSLKIAGKYTDCSNASCPGKVAVLIHKELKKRKVKGFGIKTVRKLVDGLGVKSWQELKGYNADKLATVKGISRKKALVLISAFSI